MAELPSGHLASPTVWSAGGSFSRQPSVTGKLVIENFTKLWEDEHASGVEKTLGRANAASIKKAKVGRKSQGCW
jgi:hypothetical protein